MSCLLVVGCTSRRPLPPGECGDHVVQTERGEECDSTDPCCAPPGDADECHQRCGGSPDAGSSPDAQVPLDAGVEDAGVPDLQVAADDLAMVGGSDASSGDAGAVPVPPLFDSTVTAIVHAGTSYYVGGRFTRVSPYPAPHIVALDSSGTPVACPLGTGFDGAVETMVQSGGSIYVGGGFEHYQGASAKHIAKIDATTCALDVTFTPAASNGFDGFVLALAVSGSSLYVGGNFTSYRGVAGSANDLAKLDLTSGAIDTTFSPVANNGFGGFNTGTVEALAVSGSSLYVGGAFTAYRGVAGSANRVAKLDLTSGALDTTFSPVAANGFDANVTALAVAGSSLYVGGFFGAYRGVASSANGLAKLDLTSGAIDTVFSPVGATSNGVSPARVYAVAIAGSSLYVGGEFSQYQGAGSSSAYNLAKLDVTSGAIDTTFSPAGPGNNGFDGRVYALAVAGGALYAGGQFTAYKGVAHSAERLARIDATSGALDSTFIPAGSKANGVAGNGAAVRAFSMAGSTLWVGGYFDVYAGYPANHLVKLDDATWAIDTIFSPADANGFDSWVNALVVSGTSLYAGGGFTSYKGVANSANLVAKLDLVSGALDTSFSPAGATSNGFSISYPASASVKALAVAGTSLYVGGEFSAYRGVASSANGLAKLDLSSGALDTTFSPPGATSNGFDANTQVDALAVSGSSIYAGGSFTAYRGVASSANHLAKLDLSTGAIDTTFSPPGQTTNGFDTSNPNGQVYALAIANASLYVGGEFTAYRGVANSANALAKLDLVTGDIDTTFGPPGADNNGFVPSSPYVAVLALAVSGSSLYVGGWDLTAYRGVASSANSLAKLDLVSGDIDTVFSPPGASSNGFGVSDSVWSLAVSGGALLVGGDLTVYRGTTPVGDFVPLDLAAGAPK